MGIDIFEMLKRFARIISYDYRQRNGIFRILWKSAARWNRLGWDGMLEWLDKEIWKIPNQQKILHIDTNAYRHWIQVREFQRFHSETSYDDLKFSIILAPENNDASLSRIINSLIEQHHQNWELLLLSESFDIQEGNDGRIVFIGECLQQSRIVRYNRGLSLATGEWIIFADEKMVFSPFALVEIAIAIQANSAAELIYTDEDIIDEDGKRSTPHFKSDFNPDLLYSMSYIGRAFGTRLGTARAVGGLSQSASLCADYDFVLRLWEYAGEKAIFHIPKIVFHFEKDEVDTSMRHSCEQQVLREYFARRNEKVSIASGTCPQTHRLHWSLPDTLPFVTIIIPTRDQLEVLQKCIESIL
ncbi:hypothetical protein, partial [Sulfuricurvum sp.]|uniref:hypothetical protein n=1 Tax=Sulfuricurvum sp. TaxID=2025608 RepID=UPI00260D5151